MLLRNKWSIGWTYSTRLGLSSATFTREEEQESANKGVKIVFSLAGDHEYANAFRKA